MNMPLPPMHEPAEVNTKRINDFVGEVLIIFMGGYHHVWITEYSKSAARVCAIVLSGAESGTILEDQLLFGNQGRHVAHIPPGEWTVARVALDGKATKLLACNDYDKGMARAWLTNHPDVWPNLVRETMTAYALAQSDDRAKGIAPSKASQPTASPQFVPPAVASAANDPWVQQQVERAASDDPMVRDQPELAFSSDEPAF